MKKKILITGGTGFLGSNLLYYFSKKKYKIFFTGRNILKGQEIEKKTKTKFYPLVLENNQNVLEVFGTVRPDIVIHCAALKYVDFSEKFPLECIRSNIIGSQNILLAARQFNCAKLIIISSDKASPPFNNIYGMSKAIMEKLFLLDNVYKKIDLCLIRFGNLVWSTGSVLPLWKKMKKENNLILTTGPEMSRFFYQVHSACKVIAYAADNIKKFRNKILIPDTKCAKIIDLLKEFSKIYKVKWKLIKKRPMDKDYEKLLSEQEYTNSDLIKTKVGNIFVLKNTNITTASDRSIDSRNYKKFSNKELRMLIKNHKFINV